MRIYTRLYDDIIVKHCSDLYPQNLLLDKQHYIKAGQKAYKIVTVMPKSGHLTGMCKTVLEKTT